METFTILVKGNQTQAMEAARKHGLTVKHVRTLNNITSLIVIDSGGDMHGHVSVYDVIVRWFTRDEQVSTGVGFPIGTLLHYQDSRRVEVL